MPYALSLENRAIAALMITLTAVMVLVFFGGLLVGLRTVPASGDQQQPASVPPVGAQPEAGRLGTSQKTGSRFSMKARNAS